MRQTTSTVPHLPESKIPVGISSCLLGEEVRYDGGHKRNSYITGTLGEYFDFVPVCPEAAIGLGIPREPIHLVRDKGQPVRVVGKRSPDLDVTEELTEYGRRMAGELNSIHGYILKKGSPSCGMERVKVYTPEGQPAGSDGRGVYARAFMEERPEIPVEEEGRLGDPTLRENFIERVFVHYRWRTLEAEGLTPGALVDFHSRHKLLVMAHGQKPYRELGRLVAEAGNGDFEATARTYFHSLMEALRRPAGPKGHTNVLYHLMGFLKESLDPGDKAELVEVVESYRQGFVPLVVPITLFNHHFRRHPHPYVEDQIYLQPHPAELMLRNRL
ncbi:YbgA family protein [Thiohalorhabdus methylotrophus]|uniref:YbgA family protein n=1 Tax=Thiohalorhabdus methylotrophus TaxID=3242694 RepID=A0ABV4TQY6_9GAMM